MAAYIIFIRSNTTDPSGMERYAAIAKDAPISKLSIVASSKQGAMQVLEGPPADAAVVMRFPTLADAREWYDSEAYTKARPFRQAVADCRAILIDMPD